PYPNPFNPVAKLDLTIPYDRKMDIRIFDLLGQELDVISNGEIYKSGIHQISWDGTKYSSGMYFIKINDGLDMQVRKMILIK
ncbi:MAG: T9SS type A sorting domain-containing protein, partial [Candidatus Marinimicrobia bacterium]|nr:T9SS type A sorting domain-containing protein [Candidatus Neomarinimicrobiota bacterium]